MGFGDKFKRIPIWAKLLIGFLIAALIATAIALPIILTSTEPDPTTSTRPPTSSTPAATTTPPLLTDDRIECFPFKQMDQENCTEAGCIWHPAGRKVPVCFLPTSDIYGYEVNGTVTDLPGRNKGFYVDLRRMPTANISLYGGDFDEITFEVNYYSDSTLGFALYPKGANRTRMRPPVTITPPTTGSSVNSQYTVKMASEEIGQPFNFQIVRKSTNAVIFDTSMGGLTVAEQFLMISTKVPSRYVYGFGENTHDTLLHDMNYKMWPIFARGSATGMRDMNVYGAQPYYMAAEQDGSFHGVFLFNSHAIDVTTMPNPGLTFRTIGGMLEFFVFLGPEPESVVKQYSEVIGRTFMPPYFTLGFQLSRWGYQNTSEIRAVVERTRNAQIPQDVQFADIDYMAGRKDFTIDRVNFSDLPQLVDEIKTDGVRFVIILDPAIPNAPGYMPFSRGNRSKVFVQWANETFKPVNQSDNDNNLYGRVWPVAKVAFPDFFKTSTKTWWADEISRFYTGEKFNFDALWIDMNEPSNFLTGTPVLECPENQWDDPPYGTMAANIGQTTRLSAKTICMASLFGENNEYLHYEVHNLYGYSHAIATYSALRQVLPDKRSMVLTRSTFAGSGQYAGHWLGDNYSTWKQMANSIIGMLEFNMFNIPYVGADICGFVLNADEELCERWMELGAFYTFSRNHNDIKFKPQDPAQWPDTVAVSSRKALNIRYRLLPYLYTLFYESHTVGGTVIRPLYHEYPKDLETRSIDKQFMWGRALLITPVLEPGKVTVDAYIPDDVWYDYYTGIKVQILGKVTLDAPRDHINLHVRGGYVLPAQVPALNTMLSRNNSFQLLVALDDQHSASGQLFWDDGESWDTVQQGLYQINTYKLQNNVFSINVMKGSDTWPGITQQLNFIQFMGWPMKPQSVVVNGTAINALKYTYDELTEILILKYDFDMNLNYNVEFINSA